MVFWGETVGNVPISITMSDSTSIYLLQVCLECIPKSSSEYTSLFIQTANATKGLTICHLGLQQPQFSLCHELVPEDSPFQLWTTGGKLHITGTKQNQTDGEDDDHSHSHGNEEESDGDEEASHNDESESVASREPVSTISLSEKSNKRHRPEAKTVIGTTAKTTKEQHPVQDKVAADASIQLSSQERKKWKVKPQNDEGVLVPEPRAQKKTSGVSITDFIIGKGAQPKLGAKVNITYEGSFPDGTLFDKCITRAKPFSFRMGTAQVIRGLDLGLEGMRIGGSREIFIPPALG